VKKWILILFIFLSCIMLNGQTKKVESLAKIDCKFCHTCDTPTKLNPCLSKCPRNLIITIYHSPTEAPGTIDLNQFKGISNLFGPVKFPHRTHAEMAEMNGGCSSCHHYTPNGKITPCRDCHEKNRKIAPISRPDLKGAYHQECLGCHRNWSHSIKCETCHLSKSGNPRTISSNINTLKDKYKITTPVKIVYKTDNEDNPVVTFFHLDHTKRFGLKCKNCHTNEQCKNCHDINKGKTKLAGGEAHDKCESCHDTDDKCTFCHSKTEEKQFNHFAKSGFDLTKFHSNLKCKICHKSPENFRKVSKYCNSCHSGWNENNFNHKVTGFVLNETHSDFECEACHPDRNFAVNPKCSECHDEDIYFPKKLPGKYIKRKTK